MNACAMIPLGKVLVNIAGFSLNSLNKLNSAIECFFQLWGIFIYTNQTKEYIKRHETVCIIEIQCKTNKVNERDVDIQVRTQSVGKNNAGKHCNLAIKA
jgi:hypothetical protein